MTRRARRCVVVLSGRDARAWIVRACLAILTLGLPLATWGQAPQAASPTVADSWDSLLKGASPAQPDPALNPPQTAGKASRANFADHFFFEGRSDYWRYDTSFNGGVPTLTGIINVPNNGVENANGYPFPAIFQPDAERVETILDLGTRGWGSDRINTHVTLRQYQDLSPVNPGAPAENIVETFPFSRSYQVIAGSVEIHGNPGDGYWSGFSAQIGRLNIYGTQLASLDGGALSLDRPRFSITLYGGRRFSYFSDPLEKGMGGGNFALKLGPDTSVEYDVLWYVKSNHSVGLRRRLGPSWLWSSYFRTIGASPIDFKTQFMYAPAGGKTSLRLAYYQKLTNLDYEYDYTQVAHDQDRYNTLQRLYLGPISEHAQFMIDAHRELSSHLRAGGSVWVRRLLDDKTQGPFDTSFEDYRGNLQVFPLRKTEAFLEYHQRNSGRLSPLNSTTLDNVQYSGETSVKDITADIRQTFGEGRVGLNGGVYYRRMSLQDQFFFLNNLHQSGWLAGAWLKLDSHVRLFADYNLDNDFFLFTPDLKNSRALHAGVSWKY